MRGLRAGIAVLLVATSLLCVSASAQTDASGASPRDAMYEFLSACRRGDFEAAGAYLDLRALPADERASTGPAIARRLKSVLDRQLWVDVEGLSAKPEGDLEDGLAPSAEHVGSLDVAGKSIPLALVRDASRVDRPDWRFSAATLSAVQPLLDEVPWVEEHLPPFWTRTRLFEVALWQWLALPLLVMFAMALGLLFTRLVRRPLVALMGLATAEAGEIVELTRPPARMLSSAIFFVLLLPALALSMPAFTVSRKLGIVAIALGFVWLGSRAMDVVARRAVARMRAGGRLDAAGLIPTASRIGKLLLAAVVAVLLAQNLGFNVTGLLAGLGVGGLAVALAAQKTVENLFGGVTLVADRPVQVGDFCRFGDRLGTIETIGLRSTRVRTLDRTIVTVPNAEFSSLQLENYAARDRIWLKLMLGLRYETDAEQMRAVLDALRKLLRDHPRVDPDPARVRFVGFGAYSLDLEVFAYIKTSDFDEFLEIREEILLSIMDAVAQCGTAFAFPSQTIYGTSDPGIESSQALPRGSSRAGPPAGDD
ncbi:MAG: mechanosensitive ion channel family protein [Deltaproteobacteria bacterium]|nr:mechanosensitive ion channel family protein [Deltaproteobacteria bacterium]